MKSFIFVIEGGDGSGMCTGGGGGVWEVGVICEKLNVI